VGAYGGPALENTCPNGDRVGYVTIAYWCSLSSDNIVLERAELLETCWVSQKRLSCRGTRGLTGYSTLL
jgi:hypothetical protein